MEAHPEQVPLAATLKRERELRGLSQAAAAAEMSITQQALSKWEAGSPIAPENIEAVAAFTGLSVTDVARSAFAGVTEAPLVTLLGRLEATVQQLDEMLNLLVRAVEKGDDASAPSGNA